MKKLLLLLALLIFACSSDDDNDNSNQTFLERYDGVIWKDAQDNEGYYIDFNPIGFNECDFEGDIYYGGSTNWGEINGVDGDEWVFSVVENSTERLVIEYTETNDFGQTYSYLAEIDAINNGDRIEVERSDTAVIQYFDRVSSSPCN
jgi:hypothetical protein